MRGVSLRELTRAGAEGAVALAPARRGSAQSMGPARGTACRVGLLALVLALLVGASPGALAAVKPAALFTDHMVLQQGKPVPVWGTAGPGERVTVSFAGQAKSALAGPTGEWMVRLDAMPASAAPRAMAISGVESPGETVELADIVVGEVWVLSGQSNMAWWLQTSTGGAEAIARADYPWLRLCSRLTGQLRWDRCTRQTAPTCSGVGFFFAEALHRSISAPIGLIYAPESATYGEDWVSRADMAAEPVLRDRLEAYYKRMAEYPAALAKWKRDRAEYDAQAAADRKAGKPATEMSWYLANEPEGPTFWRRPGVQYYRSICPLQPSAIRGVLWYQGEGDSEPYRAQCYRTLLGALITSWRRDWAQGDFPFLIVQLPGYVYDTPWTSWPLVREAQAMAARQIRNVGLVVTADQPDAEQIHPPNKQPVGERLARVARSLAYGERIEASGPVSEGMEVRGSIVRLRFTHVGAGLRVPSGRLDGFTLCGPDHKFRPAQAHIAGRDSVEVACDGVREPLAVRYAWAPVPSCTLYNSDGLPASPFRTDRFPDEESH